MTFSLSIAPDCWGFLLKNNHCDDLPELNVSDTFKK